MATPHEPEAQPYRTPDPPGAVTTVGSHDDSRALTAVLALLWALSLARVVATVAAKTPFGAEASLALLLTLALPKLLWDERAAEGTRRRPSSPSERHRREPAATAPPASP